jgi:hypothetical protein
VADVDDQGKVHVSRELFERMFVIEDPDEPALAERLGISESDLAEVEAEQAAIVPGGNGDDGLAIAAHERGGHPMPDSGTRAHSSRNEPHDNPLEELEGSVVRGG